MKIFNRRPQRGTGTAVQPRPRCGRLTACSVLAFRRRRKRMSKDPLQPSRCAELLAALAAAERLKIVRFLAGGPRTVTEIADMLAVPAGNVSHHLAVLKHAKLIRGKKQGRFVWYS